MSLFADSPADSSVSVIIGIGVAALGGVATVVGLLWQQVSKIKADNFELSKKQDDLAALKDGRVAPYLTRQIEELKARDAVKDQKLQECLQQHAAAEQKVTALKEEVAYLGKVAEQNKEMVNRMVDTLRAQGQMTDSAVHRILPREEIPKPASMSDHELPAVKPPDPKDVTDLEEYL